MEGDPSNQHIGVPAAMKVINNDGGRKVSSKAEAVPKDAYFAFLLLRHLRIRDMRNKVGIRRAVAMVMLYTVTMFHHTLPYSIILYHTPPYFTILYHTLPYSTILYHTLPYSIILYHTPPYSTILYHTLPYSTILHHTLPYSTILYHTLPYLPYSTILYHTLPYSTILYHTLPYSTILHHTLPYSTILYHTPPYSTILYHTPPYSTILHHTPPYSTILLFSVAMVIIFISLQCLSILNYFRSVERTLTINSEGLFLEGGQQRSSRGRGLLGHRHLANTPVDHV